MEYMDITGEGGLNVGVSMVWNDNLEKFDIELSNINIPEDYRRKGIFTSIINSLLQSGDVVGVSVRLANTPDIHSACRALKMIYNKELMTYRKDA